MNENNPEGITNKEKVTIDPRMTELVDKITKTLKFIEGLESLGESPENPASRRIKDITDARIKLNELQKEKLALLDERYEVASQSIEKKDDGLNDFDRALKGTGEYGEADRLDARKKSAGI